jgi:prolipoprotein diacylglyceryltransferase
MPDPYTTIGPFTTQTYTLVLAIGILSTMALAIMTYRLRYVVPFSRLVDVYLAALVSGVIGARVFHVILNWRYFQGNTAEITQIGAGGLNWHGAVLGALLALTVMAWFFKLSLSSLLDALAIGLPVLAFMSWWGCGAATCSYGAEVQTMADYPTWLTWEAPGQFQLIAPRFATQPLGMVFSGIVFWVMVIVARLERLEGRRFWLALALFSVGTSWLDSLRGDYAATIASLRADQWLDLTFCIFGLLVWGAITWKNAGFWPVRRGLSRTL